MSIAAYNLRRRHFNIVREDRFLDGLLGFNASHPDGASSLVSNKIFLEIWGFIKVAMHSCI